MTELKHNVDPEKIEHEARELAKTLSLVLHRYINFSKEKDDKFVTPEQFAIIMHSLSILVASNVDVCASTAEEDSHDRLFNWFCEKVKFLMSEFRRHKF